MKSARLIKGAKDIYYPGAPHGITATHQDQVNAELLAFLRSSPETVTARRPHDGRRLNHPLKGLTMRSSSTCRTRPRSRTRSAELFETSTSKEQR